MQESTGRVFKVTDEEAKAKGAELNEKLNMLTPEEYKATLGLADGDRPEEVHLMRFKAERARLGAPFNTHIENAFRLGFRIGRNPGSQE